MTYDEVHINIRRAREREGLSQSELAEELGIGRSTYVNFETGKIKIYCKTLTKLAAFYGISEEQLLFGSQLPSDELREDMLANSSENNYYIEHDYKVSDLKSKLESAERVIRAQERTISSLTETNKFLFKQLNKND